ncbi:hypothetical protein [Nonomuraea recticatena]
MATAPLRSASPSAAPGPMAIEHSPALARVSPSRPALRWSATLSR